MSIARFHTTPLLLFPSAGHASSRSISELGSDVHEVTCYCHSNVNRAAINRLTSRRSQADRRLLARLQVEIDLMAERKRVPEKAKVLQCHRRGHKWNAQCVNCAGVGEIYEGAGR